MVTQNPRQSPWQWEEFSSSEQGKAARHISSIGNNTRRNTPKAIRKLKEAANDPTNSEDYREKSASRARQLEAAKPTLKNLPISLESAATNRVALVQRAAEYASSTGETLPGAGWYFDHAREGMRHRGSQSLETMAAAMAALSPGKDPDVDELPAYRVLSELHSGNHTITITKNGKSETTPISNISPKALAKHLSKAAKDNAAGRTSSVTSSHPEFHIGGRAHMAGTEKAVQVIRGEITGTEANPPTSGPKTSSYELGILHAAQHIPDPFNHEDMSPTELDYRGIAYHLAHGDPNQGMMQFSQPEPGPIPKDHILSPSHDTAEDTWMQAITSGQDLGAVGPNGRTLSPAKRAVDKGAPGDMSQFSKTKSRLPDDPSKPGVAYVHAFNNKATRMASEMIGPVSFNQHGEAIHAPSMMIQETPWVQARREAGADAPFNQQQRERQAEFEAGRVPPAKQAKRREQFQYSEKTGDVTVTTPQMFAGGAITESGEMTPFRTNPQAKPPKAFRK